MTETSHRDRPRPRSTAGVPTHTIVVPPSVPMVSLLGPRDELLRTIERAFPRLDIHVRGNEITITGPAAEIALVERLFDELLVVIADGPAADPRRRRALDRDAPRSRPRSARPRC